MTSALDKLYRSDVSKDAQNLRTSLTQIVTSRIQMIVGVQLLLTMNGGVKNGYAFPNQYVTYAVLNPRYSFIVQIYYGL